MENRAGNAKRETMLPHNILVSDMPGIHINKELGYSNMRTSSLYYREILHIGKEMKFPIIKM